MTLTKQDLDSTLYCLNVFPDQYEKAKKSNYYSLPTPKTPFGYTFSKDDLFCHQIHEVRKHPNSHIRVSARLELNNNWLFSIKEFIQTSNQFLLSKNVNLHHSETLEISTNCFPPFPFVVYLKAIIISNNILCSLQDSALEQQFFSKFQNVTCFI